MLRNAGGRTIRNDAVLAQRAKEKPHCGEAKRSRARCDVRSRQFVAPRDNRLARDVVDRFDLRCAHEPPQEVLHVALMYVCTLRGLQPRRSIDS